MITLRILMLSLAGFVLFALGMHFGAVIVERQAAKAIEVNRQFKCADKIQA